MEDGIGCYEERQRRVFFDFFASRVNIRGFDSLTVYKLY